MSNMRCPSCGQLLSTALQDSRPDKDVLQAGNCLNEMCETRTVYALTGHTLRDMNRGYMGLIVAASEGRQIVRDVLRERVQRKAKEN